MFQSNHRGMLLIKKSLYLSSKFVGKFSGKILLDFDLLLKGLKLVTRFLVVTKMYRMRYL